MHDLETQIARSRKLAMLEVRRRLDERNQLDEDIKGYEAILADPEKSDEHDYNALCLSKTKRLRDKITSIINLDLELLDVKEECLGLEFELLSRIDEPSTQ